MNVLHTPDLQRGVFPVLTPEWHACIFFAFVVHAPGLAQAQSDSPFDAGFTSLYTSSLERSLKLPA